ncbi:MAG: nucleotide exchange factor GrpE [Candidatus Izemoplasmataceae bacterium]|jgi:molecular chaperone GrpE
MSKKKAEDKDLQKEETVEEIIEETQDETVTEVETTSNEEALKEEIQSLKDQLLRNQAELQNFKRRMNEERIKDRIFANVDLVKKLMTPLDNLEIGLMNESDNGEIKPYAKGFEMIRRDLMETLKEEGLNEIDALNKPFDPTLHQAVAKEKRDGVESNLVIEVYQKGYTFKDRLIRPSMVKVSE